jgi:hypothetical protein
MVVISGRVRFGERYWGPQLCPRNSGPATAFTDYPTVEITIVLLSLPSGTDVEALATTGYGFRMLRCA